MIVLQRIVSVLQNDKIRYKEDEIQKIFQDYFVKESQMPRKEFAEKWRKSRVFVNELIHIGAPQFTCLVGAYTIWGKPRYHEYVFNVGEIKHNPEFVKSLLSLGSIWKCDFDLERRRAEVSNSKNKEGDEPFTAAFKWIVENRIEEKGLLEKYIHDDYRVNYLYLTDLCWEKEIPYNIGRQNMRTATKKFNAIVY